MVVPPPPRHPPRAHAQGAQDGTRDTEYLELLRAILRGLMDKVQPQLLIYHVRCPRLAGPPPMRQPRTLTPQRL
jgi:hypothetical protein